MLECADPRNGCPTIAWIVIKMIERARRECGDIHNTRKSNKIDGRSVDEKKKEKEKKAG